MSGTHIVLPPGVGYESNRIAFELLTGNVLALKVVGIDGSGQIIGPYPTMYQVSGTVFVTGTVNIPNMVQITVTVFVTGTVNVVNVVNVINTPATPLAYELISAASTNATLVKSSPGVLYNITLSNLAVADRHVKIYNRNTLPVVGTSIPIMTIHVPRENANHSINFGALGQYFSAGIAFAITVGDEDNNTQAIGAGEIKLNLSYL